MKIIEQEEVTDEYLQQLAKDLFETRDARILVIGGRKKDFGQFNLKQFTFWPDEHRIGSGIKAPARTKYVLRLRITTSIFKDILGLDPDVTTVLSFQTQNEFMHSVAELHGQLAELYRAERQAKKDRNRQEFEARKAATPSPLAEEAVVEAPIAVESPTAPGAFELDDDIEIEEVEPEVVPSVAAQVVVPSPSKTVGKEGPKKQFRGLLMQSFLVEHIPEAILYDGNVGKVVLYAIGEMEKRNYKVNPNTVRSTIDLVRAKRKEELAKTTPQVRPSTPTLPDVEPAPYVSEEKTLRQLQALVENLVGMNDPKAKLFRKMVTEWQEGRNQVQETEQLQQHLQSSRNLVEILRPYEAFYLKMKALEKETMNLP